MTDSRTGKSWGGVTSTGGRAGITHLYGVDNQYGIFVSGAYHQLTGNNVDSNTRKKSLLESLKPWLKLLTPP
jgi:hypothetical protein